MEYPGKSSQKSLTGTAWGTYLNLSWISTVIINLKLVVVCFSLSQADASQLLASLTHDTERQSFVTTTSYFYTAKGTVNCCHSNQAPFRIPANFEIRHQKRMYMEKNAYLLLGVVIKLRSLSFYVEGLVDSPEPFGSRPVNLGVFIPLPAGLVEIKQGEHGPGRGGWRVRFIQRSVQKRHSCLGWDGPVPWVINNPETPAIAVLLQTTVWPVDLLLALLIHSYLISHTNSHTQKPQSVRRHFPCGVWLTFAPCVNCFQMTKNLMGHFIFFLYKFMHKFRFTQTHKKTIIKYISLQIHTRETNIKERNSTNNIASQLTSFAWPMNKCFGQEKWGAQLVWRFGGGGGGNYVSARYGFLWSDWLVLPRDIHRHFVLSHGTAGQSHSDSFPCPN